MDARIADWLHLNETDFHDRLRSELLRTGEIGDVFPEMVGHNVPHYILKRLWPEAWERFQTEPEWVSFTVAEPGWKGRIDNLRSELREVSTEVEAAAGAGASELRLDFNKSYVLECDRLLLLARYGDDDFALAWVPRSGARNWTSRGEPGVRFLRSQPGAGREVFDHFLVEGSLSLNRSDFLPLPRRKYAVVGMQVPRREITSIAVVAGALLEYHRLLSASEAERMSELRGGILAGREADRIGKAELGLAAEMLDLFFARVEEKSTPVHPFWEKARELRNFIIGSGEKS